MLLSRSVVGDVMPIGSPPSSCAVARFGPPRVSETKPTKINITFSEFSHLFQDGRGNLRSKTNRLALDFFVCSIYVLIKVEGLWV